jgi:hypothetical protein
MRSIHDDFTPLSIERAWRAIVCPSSGTLFALVAFSCCDVRFLGQIAPTASPTALLREDALSIPTTARLCEAVGVAGGILGWKRVGQRRA